MINFRRLFSRLAKPQDTQETLQVSLVVPFRPHPQTGQPQIWMGQRVGSKKVAPNQWAFMGGKPQKLPSGDMESGLAAAAREFAEETGLNLPESRFMCLGQFANPGAAYDVFLVEVPPDFDPEKTHPDFTQEHQGQAWVTLKGTFRRTLADMPTGMQDNLYIYSGELLSQYHRKITRLCTRTPTKTNQAAFKK